jgi:ABC-type amino acid transport substrate-binding protein
MKKILFTLMALVMVGHSVAAQTTLKVAVAHDTNALLPVISAIYAEMGYEAEFEEIPPERALAQISRSNAYDAYVGLTIDSIDQFPNLIFTHEVLLEFSIQAWVRKGSPITIKTPQDLISYRIGQLRGTKGTLNLLAASDKEVKETNSMESLAQMLWRGRFDVALVPSILNTVPLEEVGQLAAPNLLRTKGVHVFSKKHTELVKKWDTILKTMKADGRYKKLLQAGPTR